MINRRSILSGSALLAAAGSAAAGPKSQSASPRAGRPDVVVVGQGAFGGWTALTLRERGLKVVSIDEYGPATPRAASSGETRSIRSGYGKEARYSAWAAKALKLWNQRQQEFGRQILYPNDRLELAQDWNPALVAQRQIFDDLKIPYEILNREQLRARYKQMNFDDIEFAFIEKTTAAVIKARESMIIVSDVFRRKGGEVRIARALPGPSTGRTLDAVALNTGDSVAAAQFVFCCGPWSPKTFPKIMAPKIKVYRSEYFYFGVPAGDERFSWPNQPAWHDHTTHGYGFGSIERGLKYSPADNGVTQDPDSAERLPTPLLMKQARDFVYRRFPDMRDAPIVETRACNYESPSNSDFIVDRHPDYDNVWIASGGGGHGFKHGPLIGEYVADRLMGRPTFDPEAGKLFTLAAHANQNPVSGME